MTTLILDGFNAITGWWKYLDPFEGTIRPVMERCNSIGRFVFDIFDSINFLIPIDTIFHCLEIMAAFYLISFGVWLALWVIRRLADIIP